jgi:hypothetical protein
VGPWCREASDDEGVAVAKLDEQLTALLMPVLAVGEELIAAAKVNYNGTIAPNTVSIDVAIASVGEASGTPIELDPDAAIAFPVAKQMALGLTGGRIFVWSLGFSGKPKQFVGELPLSAIVEIRLDPSGYGGQLEVVMKSGARVDLEFARGEPAEQFCAELGALVEG